MNYQLAAQQLKEYHKLFYQERERRRIEEWNRKPLGDKVGIIISSLRSIGVIN